MAQTSTEDSAKSKGHDHEPFCGVTSERLEKKMRENPGFRRLREQAEAHIRAYAERRENESARSSNDTLWTIPVVFHVLYNDSTENLPRARVLSQLRILNEDFRRENSDTDQTRAIFDSVTADTRIQFCLAKRNPQGFHTDGITRTYTDRLSFSSPSDEMKDPSTGGKAAWPASDYLNFWVCNLGPGPIGFATQPGGDPEDDGIVVDYEYIGDTLTYPSMTGRVGTHEAGHWLSLLHTFHNGCSGTTPSTCDTAGDRCCDTPPAENPYYGCPDDTLNDCNETPDLVNQWENYMAYTDGPCQNMFTKDQKSRMRATLAPGGLRRSIIRSNKCDSILDRNAELSEVLAPQKLICDSNGLTPRLVLLNRGMDILDSVIIRYRVDNQAFQSFYWDDSLANGDKDTIDLPSLTPSSGSRTFEAHIISDSINGDHTDQDPSNDSISSTFFYNGSGMGSEIGVHFWDICEGASITWKLLDSNGVTIGTGGPYWNDLNGAYIGEQIGCLPEGCYEFRVYSSDGDGLTDPNCNTDDDYFIRLGTEKLVQMTAPNGAFGDSAVHTFCIDFPHVITNDINCSGGYGSIEVQPDDSIYEYSIDSGISYQNNNSFYSLGAGVYNVALRHTGNGTTKYTQASIQSPPPLEIDSTDLVQPLCKDSSNGSITIFASGGVSPYSYSFDGGSSFQNSNVLQGLSSGSYNLIVKDSNGCSSSVTDSLSDPPEIEALAGPDQEICKGEGVHLGADPAVIGGNGESSISWSPVSSLDSPSIDTPLATPDSSTYYELLATDTNGCSDLDSVFVLVKPAPTAIINGDSVLNGTNDSVLLDGSNSSSASGNLDHQWSAFSGGTIVSPDSTTPTIAAGSAGLYVLKVTDPNNACTDEDSIYVKDVTGIDRKDLDEQLEFYPNPTEGKVFFDLGTSYEEVEATVRDVTGRVIARRRFENVARFQMDLNSATGMYLIDLRVNNGRKKVIKVIRE